MRNCIIRMVLSSSPVSPVRRAAAVAVTGTEAARRPGCLRRGSGGLCCGQAGDGRKGGRDGGRVRPALSRRRRRELWGLFFVCCLYSVDVKNLRRELI